MSVIYGKNGLVSGSRVYGAGGEQVGSHVYREKGIDTASMLYTKDILATRNIPTLSGTQYGTLSSVVSVTSGDTLERKFATTTSGTSMFFFGHSSTPMSAEFDAGDLLQLVGCTATIDGNAVADGADISSYQDGKVHIYLFTATGSFSVGYLNQNGSGAGFFIGQDLSAKFTVSGVVTNYVFDSGSTTEQYARGSDTLKVNLINFASGDWNRYTLQRNITHDAGTVALGWLGDNDIVNGTFNTNTDNWNAIQSAVLTVNNNRLRVTNGDALFGKAEQPTPTILGVHIVRLKSWDGTGTPNLRIGTTSSGTQLLSSNVPEGEHAFLFTALSATSYVNVSVNGNTLGQYVEYDNISVQPLIEVA